MGGSTDIILTNRVPFVRSCLFDHKRWNCSKGYIPILLCWWQGEVMTFNPQDLLRFLTSAAKIRHQAIQNGVTDLPLMLSASRVPFMSTMKHGERANYAIILVENLGLTLYQDMELTTMSPLGSSVIQRRSCSSIKLKKKKARAGMSIAKLIIIKDNRNYYPWSWQNSSSKPDFNSVFTLPNHQHDNCISGKIHQYKSH